MHTPVFIQMAQGHAAPIRDELVSGLLATPAHIHPKYLYDELGSKLFAAITCIPEYYPTRTEAIIFQLYAEELARTVPWDSVLIDLGAGNCEKAAKLFDIFHPKRYIAIDISVDFLKNSLECLQRQFPNMFMAGVGMDFSDSLALPDDLDLCQTSPRVLFYPGSSIGNFSPDQALTFLKRVHSLCAQTQGGGLLIGVDLVKDSETLRQAYDDELGVTAAFNRNMLLHLNRLAGTNFDIRHWKHIGLYNTELNRIEMHLEATKDVEVRWGISDDQRRAFKAGERIHTENSWKWTLDSFGQLLEQAGFTRHRAFTDPAQQFAVFWASH